MGAATRSRCRENCRRNIGDRGGGDGGGIDFLYLQPFSHLSWTEEQEGGGEGGHDLRGLGREVNLAEGAR